MSRNDRYLIDSLKINGVLPAGIKAALYEEWTDKEYVIEVLKGTEFTLAEEGI